MCQEDGFFGRTEQFFTYFTLPDWFAGFPAGHGAKCGYINVAFGVSLQTCSINFLTSIYIYIPLFPSFTINPNRCQ